MNVKEKYGPFSPQELESKINWLESHDIEFELVKDKESERSFQNNDPQNFLALAEFRTKVYLAQIFYLQISFLHQQQKQDFEKNFIVINEQAPNWLNKLASPMSTGEAAQKHTQKQRFWATVLNLTWLGYIVFYYFRE